MNIIKEIKDSKDIDNYKKIALYSNLIEAYITEILEYLKYKGDTFRNPNKDIMSYKITKVTDDSINVSVINNNIEKELVITTKYVKEHNASYLCFRFNNQTLYFYIDPNRCFNFEEYINNNNIIDDKTFNEKILKNTITTTISRKKVTIYNENKLNKIVSGAYTLYPQPFNKNEKVVNICWASKRADKHTVNEDACLPPLQHPNDPNLIIAAVADGVGGMENGSLAANKAITILKETFNILPKDKLSNKYIQSTMETIINQIHYRIKEECPKAGTTLSIVITTNNNTHIFNIGDSRVYYVDKTKNIVLATEDDSLVWKEVSKNNATADELRFMKGNNIITQALGGKSDTVIPFYTRIKNSQIQRLFLTTDGIHDNYSQDELLQTASTQTNENPAISIVTKSSFPSLMGRKPKDDDTTIMIVDYGRKRR
ncbi:MAG: serine/threonine-protein phosphatase [bacterium]|nr:serine/threonine-protein phosphatase [bacterium]